MWIDYELKNRGWSQNELARRGGISSSAISMVRNGDRGITLDFCAAIAKAFNEPPETVLRLAGLLPPTDDELQQQVVEAFGQLSPERRREVLNFIRYQLEQDKTKSVPPGLLSETPG